MISLVRKSRDKWLSIQERNLFISKMKHFLVRKLLCILFLNSLKNFIICPDHISIADGPGPVPNWNPFQIFNFDIVGQSQNNWFFMPFKFFQNRCIMFIRSVKFSWKKKKILVPVSSMINKYKRNQWEILASNIFWTSSFLVKTGKWLRIIKNQEDLFLVYIIFSTQLKE